MTNMNRRKLEVNQLVFTEKYTMIFVAAICILIHVKEKLAVCMYACVF